MTQPKDFKFAPGVSVLFLNNYQDQAMRTAKMFEDPKMNLMHAALGVGSDSGELVDAVKKHVIYGKPLDVANVREEIGDVLWYLALSCAAIGTTLDEVATENIEKLRKRYPEKYSDADAIARADKIKYVIAESEEHAVQGLQIAGPFDTVAEAQRSEAYKTGSECVFPIKCK